MILPSSAYVFTPKSGSTAGTIDFSAMTGFNPAQLAGVKHLPTGITLYAPLASLRGTFAGSVLTLAVDTTGLNASDLLLVSYATNATGLPTDAATASGANTTVIGALRAIRDRLLATLAVSGTVTANQGAAGAAAWLTADGADPAAPAVANAGTGARGWLATIAGLLRLGTATSANSASVVLATDMANLEPGGIKVTAATMPAGGVGLTGWLSGILLAVTGANGRSLPFAPLLANTNLAAGGSAVTAERATGATAGSAAGPYTKYNVYVKAGDQPLTVNVLGRPVSNGTTFTLDTQTVAAGAIFRGQYNLVFAVMLLQVLNGSTATTGTYAADSLSIG